MALVAGARGDADASIRHGADKAGGWARLGRRAMVEDYVPTIARLAGEYKPFGLLVGATLRGKAVAGRLAARLEASVITEFKAFEWSGGALNRSPPHPGRRRCSGRTGEVGDRLGDHGARHI